MALQDIDHIVVVMLENRSFDHMLGYLSLPTAPPGGPVGVRGLSAAPGWQDAHANRYNGVDHPVRPLTASVQVLDDPRHNREAINEQITTPSVGPGVDQMGGFVKSYAERSKTKPADPGLAMGYYDQTGVPIFDFFARNFAVCDHWFASLPCGTQPNRLMAMAGESRITNNADLFLPEHRLVYEWLTEKGVSWCAYQSGGFFPFFTLMKSMSAEILYSLTLPPKDHKGKFRRYKYFADHWTAEAPPPSVMFIEPEYSSGPRKKPNDDHPPTGVARGQEFLADIYETLISNPARWARTLMIVTYDEHGGFYDHEPPLKITAQIEGKTIPTTGVRVPAMVVSPQVQPCSVFTGDLDHTSIIQLLVDKFSPNEGFSVAVNARQTQLNRLMNILRPPPAAAWAPPIPAGVREAVRKAAGKAPIGAVEGTSVEDPSNAQAMHRLALRTRDEHAELLQSSAWKDVRDYLAENPDPPA